MISIEHRNEAGEVLEEFGDPRAIESLFRVGLRVDRCLGFIDPYGDTCFNQEQLPVLVAELEAALGEVSPDNRTRLLSLIAFLRAKTGQIHTYLWFVGE
jgi:hypothetical protein